MEVAGLGAAIAGNAQHRCLVPFGQHQPRIDRDHEPRFGTVRELREFMRRSGHMISGFAHKPLKIQQDRLIGCGSFRPCRHVRVLAVNMSFCRLGTRRIALESWPAFSLWRPAPSATNRLSGAFLLANSCLMAYGRVVMSLSETISYSDVCLGRMRLSKPEGRVSRRSSTRHCAAHAVPQPYAMRETIRGVRDRRICTAWGVGHPDEP